MSFLKIEYPDMHTLKMNSSFTLILIFLIMVPSANAQITFEKTYGGAGKDIGVSVLQTSDKGYIIAGSTTSFGAGASDMYLVRTDSHGDTLWTRTYGGAGNDDGFAVQQTFDGGYAIVGRTKSFGSGMEDVYLVKTNSSGDTLWTRTFGGADNDKGLGFRQTSDGGYIIVGETWSFGAGFDEVYLIKVNSSGDTVWTRTFGGNAPDIAYDVVQTSDGGYITAGYSWSFADNTSTVQLVKTDIAGNPQWMKDCGGVKHTTAYSIDLTSDGGFIIGGWIDPNGVGTPDAYLVKTDSLGDTLWTNSYGGTDVDFARSVIQTSDHGYVFTGLTQSFGADSGNVYLVRTNSSGKLLWTKTFGSNGIDGGGSVRQTFDGGFIVTGWTTSPGNGNYDMYLIRTDSNGIATSVKTDRVNSISAEYKLSQNYPNPFNPSTVIDYRLPVDNYVTLKVYNILGRLVATLVDEFQPPGYKSIKWNASEFAGGVYFYRLNAGTYSQTKKLMVIK